MIEPNTYNAAPAKKPHTLKVENRHTLTAGGIVQIISYDEYSATLETDFGTLIIGGNHLCVNEISTSTGELSITGDIEYIQYQAKHNKSEGEGFFKRLIR